MKTPARSLFLFLFFSALLLTTTPSLRAADLPTVTIEHLYYLQSRADCLRKYKPEEMVNYCLAQKIGGTAFEYLNSQLFTLRIELAKLAQIQEASDTDPRVVTLRKSIDVYTSLLHAEASRIQDGILREGQVATDTLQVIAKAQNAR